MSAHAAKGLNSHTGEWTMPHLDARGDCICDCSQCSTANDMCVCPDCIGGDVCGLHLDFSPAAASCGSPDTKEER